MLPDVAKVVTPDGIVVGVPIIEGDRVAGIEERDGAPAGWVLPGFVDLHCHGGDGASYTVGDADQARRAAAFHARRGTTTTLASLVSSPIDLMLEATAAFAPLVDEGVIAGIHFEGPYLSETRCGAQNPRYLRDPSVDELSRLYETGGRAIGMMTIAPERDGALEAIRWLTDHGIVAAVGHTDASLEQTEAAIDAGARAATHLFNGMRSFAHRDPGPVPALLADPRVVSELIADPYHLHRGTLRFALRISPPHQTVLVSDAISATGLGDGEHELGGLGVNVTDGAARLSGTGSLAGSTITVLDALRHCVNRACADFVAVSRMASTTPAAVLGLTDVGALEAGKRADLVVLDDDLELQGVMRAGAWLDTA